MSSMNINKPLPANSSKKKKRNDIQTFNYKISETSNKILQAIEAKIKEQKDKLASPVLQVQSNPKEMFKERMQHHKNKSCYNIPSSVNTMGISNLFDKTSKNTISTLKPISPQTSQSNMIHRKRVTTSGENFRSLSGSSSFTTTKKGDKNNKTSIHHYHNNNSDQRRLLTSNSYAGKKPTFESFQSISKITKSKYTPIRPLSKSKPSFRGEIKDIKSTTTSVDCSTTTNNNNRYMQLKDYTNALSPTSHTPISMTKKIGNSPKVAIKSKHFNSSYTNKNNHSITNIKKHINPSQNKINNSNYNLNAVLKTENNTNCSTSWIYHRANNNHHNNTTSKKGANIQCKPIKRNQEKPKSITHSSVSNNDNNNQPSTSLPNTMTATPITIRSAPIYRKIGQIDSVTQSGTNSQGEEKVNQDNYFITQNFLNEPEQYLFGVCDGHGQRGHEVSEFIVNTLPDKFLNLFLYDKPDLDSNTKIIEGFMQLNNELICNNNIDSCFSGTTCIATIISKEKIVSCNLGDSRAVLGRYEKGSWNAYNLSRDHKATEVDESTRIIRKGGRIASYINSDTRENVGPQRVWLKEADIPGLAMTRSFGDQIAHCIGVISEPEIKEYQFNGTEKFIVLASDGLWEFIDSLECIHLIKDYYLQGDATGACHSIVAEAYSRWSKEEQAIDDITVVIGFFE